MSANKVKAALEAALAKSDELREVLIVGLLKDDSEHPGWGASSEPNETDVRNIQHLVAVMQVVAK